MRSVNVSGATLFFIPKQYVSSEGLAGTVPVEPILVKQNWSTQLRAVHFLTVDLSTQPSLLLARLAKII